MTAKELHEALQGVPEEALCQTIRYLPSLGWSGKDGRAIWSPHAAALQRDAMTEWLSLNEIDSQTAVICTDIPDDGTWGVYFCCGHGNAKWLALDYPTRLHALAAACRYVAAHAPSSSASSEPSVS